VRVVCILLYVTTVRLVAKGRKGGRVKSIKNKIFEAPDYLQSNNVPIKSEYDRIYENTNIGDGKVRNKKKDRYARYKLFRTSIRNVG